MPQRRVKRLPQSTRLPMPPPTSSQSHHSSRSFAHLSTRDQLAWVISAHERLTRKQRRERAYLDRRAARSTFTPTDEAYEQDQMLETELLDLLDLLNQYLQNQLAQ